MLTVVGTNFHFTNIFENNFNKGKLNEKIHNIHINIFYFENI